MVKKQYHTNREFKNPSINDPNQMPSRFYGDFTAIVKDTSDYQRMGRIKAWCPDLGGSSDDENDQQHWRLFQYVTPFGGMSPADPKDILDDWPHTPTAYGFWAVPPDIGNILVVSFLNGDPNRGIWKGCLYQSYMNHSIPDIASAPSSTGDFPPERPVTEYSKNDSDVGNPLGPRQGRPEHRDRFLSLL